MATAALSFSHREWPGGGRFEALVAGHEALGPVDLDYELDGRRALFVHTGTPPALRGQGLAAQITQHAWDWAQSLGLEVVPVCPYVGVWMRRNGHG